MTNLNYITDGHRHLICVPYSISNLHQMAEELGIKRHWFHKGNSPHYDIPKTRIEEIEAKCGRLSSRQIVAVIRAARKK